MLQTCIQARFRSYLSLARYVTSVCDSVACQAKRLGVKDFVPVSLEVMLARLRMFDRHFVAELNWKQCWYVCACLIDMLCMSEQRYWHVLQKCLQAIFCFMSIQVLGISSVKTDTDVWLIDSCVKCKKAAPCEAWRPSLRFRDIHSLFPSCSEIECVLAVRLTPPTAPRNASPCGSHLQIATAMGRRLYHELVRAAAGMDWILPDSVAETPAFRLQLRDMFRNAQWLC